MRFEALRENLRGAIWALPALAVVLALIAGSVLSRVDISRDARLNQLLFQGTASDARALLIAVSSTMVTVIALVLGLTLVALQLASTQFSPRLLRNFLRDRANQVVLSAFVATFAYSAAGLYTVGVSAEHRSSSYPRLAVTGALVLLFVSLALLVYFVHHLSHSIQIDQVMVNVQRSTLAIIEHDLPVRGTTVAPVPEPLEWCLALPAEVSGYVQILHPEVLVGQAAKSDLLVSIGPMLGEHVVAGMPLGWIWTAVPELMPADADAWRVPIHDAIRIGFERTTEQDVAFGVRQLTDIAVKALSPAINDPYTAIQASEHIAVLLSALARRAIGNQELVDDSGKPRVYVHGRDLAYFLDFSCGQIRRYGSTEPRLLLAILRTLRTTGLSVNDEHRRSMVARQVRLVLADGARDIAQSSDLEPVRSYAESVLRDIGERM